MSDQQKHTPEDQWTDYDNELPRTLNRADYSRAVACVKALAGLNPAAVREVREVLEEIVSMQRTNYGDATETHLALIELAEKSRTALDNLKEGA